MIPVSAIRWFCTKTTRRSLRDRNSHGGHHAHPMASQSARRALPGSPVPSSFESDPSKDRIEGLVREVLQTSRRADIPNLLSLMAECDTRRYRTPLRDLTSKLLPELSHSPPLSQVMRALTLSGRGMVFFQELFDYCVKQPMSPTELSLFVYECGRHGLRCKHYLDEIFSLPSTLTLINQMSQDDLHRCFKGLCKSASDYSPTVHAMISRVRLDKMSPESTLILLRVVKQVSDRRTFHQIISRAPFATFSSVDKCNAIYLMKQGKAFRLNQHTASEAKRIASQLVAELATQSEPQLNADLITTDITDCLDAMAGMRIRNLELLSMFSRILVARVAEIKYSPICGLWQAITDSFGHLQYFSAPWMRIVEELASSQYNLNAFASFQLIFFTSSLGRLNFFSPKIFQAVAEVIASDIHSIKDSDMLATLLFPFERAGFASPVLVEACLNQAVSICKNRPRNNSSRNEGLRGVLNVTYLVISLGTPVYDPKLQILSEYLSSHFESGDEAILSLTNFDLMRLRRLVVLGLPLGHLPESISGSPHYRLWANSDVTETASDPFVEYRKVDGTAVVVLHDIQEEQMMVWSAADGGDKLIPHSTTGTEEMIRRFLCAKGDGGVHFVRRE